MTPPLSVYLHIPFCQVRCAYCDFNTYAGLDDLIEPYTQALAREIGLVSQAGGRPAVHTVFFGGGTPSLLPLHAYERLFRALHTHFVLMPGCEITLEANPGTISRDYLRGLRGLGVNRLSFGVQSSHPHELRLLDRLHLFGDVVQAVRWARAAGFDDLNLDLIFALPQQTLHQWQQTLERVVALGPEHVSAYALSLEHGTPMRAWVYKGLLPMPDPDLAAEMYEWTSDRLAGYGYAQYEISNWARGGDGSPALPRYACHHNVQYWRNEPYLGLGAGAHGFAAGLRYADVLAPAAYIQRLSGEAAARPYPLSPAVAQHSPVSRDDALGETMMMGLRLTDEGVTDARFRARFGLGLADRYGAEIERLQQRGLVDWDGERLRLTSGGRLLGNEVFAAFLIDPQRDVTHG
jgi:oxygen-independent coproporphyrinogen-3 oxidase